MWDALNVLLILVLFVSTIGLIGLFDRLWRRPS